MRIKADKPKPKSRRGGARIGAGRPKSLAKVTTSSISMTLDEWRKLDVFAHKRKVTRSRVVRDLVEKIEV